MRLKFGVARKPFITGLILLVASFLVTMNPKLVGFQVAGVPFSGIFFPLGLLMVIVGVVLGRD